METIFLVYILVKENRFLVNEKKENVMGVVAEKKCKQGALCDTKKIRILRQIRQMYYRKKTENVLVITTHCVTTETKGSLNIFRQLCNYNLTQLAI